MAMNSIPTGFAFDRDTTFPARENAILAQNAAKAKDR